MNCIMHRENFNRSHTEMIFEKCRHVFELIRFDHSELAVGYRIAPSSNHLNGFVTFHPSLSSSYGLWSL